MANSKTEWIFGFIILALVIVLGIIAYLFQFDRSFKDLIYVLIFCIIGAGLLMIFYFYDKNQDGKNDKTNSIRFNNLTIQKLRKKHFSALNINAIRTETILFIIGIVLLVALLVLNYAEIIDFRSIYANIMFIGIIWLLTIGVYIIFQRADSSINMYILIISIGAIGNLFVVLSYFFKV